MKVLKSILVLIFLLVCLLTDIFAGSKMEVLDKSGKFLDFFDEHSSLVVDLESSASVGEIFIQSGPDAFEPFLLRIKSGNEVDHVSIESTNLISDTAVIDSNYLDFRVVNAWYQAGTAGENISYSKNRILISELLLHDENLIKSESAQNYLKIIDGSYIHISSDEKITQWIFPEASTFPVRDSQKLVPFQINKNQEKRVWLTMNIPESATPGIYTGKLLISGINLYRVEVPIVVRVLPFQLAQPEITFSIYYRGQLQENHPTISSDLKDRTQLKIELENIKNHGIDSPGIYQPYSRNLSLFNVLKIREKAGISNKEIYYLGFNTGSPSDEKELQELEKKVSSVVKVCRTFNSGDIYFYGVEEVMGGELLSQRLAWDRVKQAGGKVFIAGYPGTLEQVGASLDLLVAKNLNLSSAEKAHRNGTRIFIHKPQGGIEDPLLYRKEYGYRLWASGYDGAIPYAYQHGFGHIWNDFDHQKYRDHNFTYPTMDGVIDTVQWEGFREGIDDIRYLVTLKQYVEKADDPKGRSFLESIQLDRDLDPRAVRSEAIRHILRILSIMGTTSDL